MKNKCPCHVTDLNLSRHGLPVVNFSAYERTIPPYNSVGF